MMDCIFVCGFEFFLIFIRFNLSLIKRSVFTVSRAIPVAVKFIRTPLKSKFDLKMTHTMDDISISHTHIYVPVSIMSDIFVHHKYNNTTMQNLQYVSL